MADRDPFFSDHRAFHEQQRARLLLLWVVTAAAFAIVALMVFIAFRPL